MHSFPIDPLLPAIRQTLNDARALVLQAAPGAGKSTRVPPALLACEWLAGRKVILLEPRRLAARAVARFMAHALGEKPGETVGYRVRLDSCVGPRTRIEVVTEGVLTRMLQDDPALEGVGLVIFDEYHERSLQADLGLALCLESQSALREDLRLLVMSATLDGLSVAELMGGAPVIESSGRSFPVDIRYQPLHADAFRQGRVFFDEVAALIGKVLSDETGSMLVFLPGVGEIRQVHERLKTTGLPNNTRLAPLYGQLDARDQDAAINPAPQGQRKIVLATAIAETSLTIEGIRIVVDCGLSRRSRFDPNTGLDRLVTLRVSQAAADQRAGRAGRLEPGVCYRMWSQNRHLIAHTEAELVSADLAPLMLELALWGVKDCTQLHWLDVPPAGHVAQALALLRQLGAVDDRHSITAHGRAMAGLGVHPRLAHMLLRGAERGYARLAAELAAVLSEADPLRSLDDSDVRLRVEWLRGAAAGQSQARRRSALRSVAKQWQRRVPCTETIKNGEEDLAYCGALLAFAYPDRIAQRRPGGDNRFVLSNGRGARFTRPEPLAAEAMLVAAHLDGEREARIFLAAVLYEEHLFEWHSELVAMKNFVVWDDKEQAVRARVQRVLGELILDDRAQNNPPADALQQAMLEGIRHNGLDCLPWNDSLRQLQARVNFLHRQDAVQWPDFSDEKLLRDSEHWLLPFLNNITRLAQLKRLDLRAALLSCMDWAQQQKLEQLAPTHIQVPSGSTIHIDYSNPVPVLAVRLQEMFGLKETPRIAGGRVTLLLHLLSPARRPVQITQDLATFWRGSYREVKKDLQGRYPKHYWPDDPLRAQPTARAKPRK